jgi:hypothetical protein
MPLFINAADWPPEYATDSALQAVDTTTVSTGSLAYSEETGLYYFSNQLADLPTGSLASDDGLGSWLPSDKPYIRIDSNDVISADNVGELTAANTATYTQNTAPAGLLSVFHIVTTAGSTNNVDTVMTEKMRIHRVEAIPRAIGTASDTLRVTPRS